MDDRDVRYIVERAVEDLRYEMKNEIDRLSDAVAKQYCLIRELEEWRRIHESCR